MWGKRQPAMVVGCALVTYPTVVSVNTHNQSSVCLDFPHYVTYVARWETSLFKLGGDHSLGSS